MEINKKYKNIPENYKKNKNYTKTNIIIQQKTKKYKKNLNYLKKKKKTKQLYHNK